MKRIAIIAGLMLLVIGVNAQGLNKKNTGVHVSATVGASLDMGKKFVGNTDYLLSGNVDESLSSINLRLGLSYFIIPEISVGAGIGLDSYSSYEMKSFPIYLEVKYYIFDTRNTPFIYGSAGQLVNDSSAARRKGVIADAGIGYKFFAGNNFCLNATIGYTFRKLRNIDIVPLNMNEVSVGIGIVF